MSKDTVLDSVNAALKLYANGEDSIHLDDIAYPVMVRKGFWLGTGASKEAFSAHIDKQLLHLFLEITEFMESGDYEADELADVLIVLADLAGGLGQPILGYWLNYNPASVTGGNLYGAARRIGQQWRKTGHVEPGAWRLMCETIARVANAFDIDIRMEFVHKMYVNMERENLYGTPESGERVSGGDSRPAD